MAQVLSQEDGDTRQRIPASKVLSYPSSSRDDVFGRGMDILPMNFRLIDLRV